MSAVVVEPRVLFEHPAAVADELAGKPSRVLFVDVPEHRFVMIGGVRGRRPGPDAQPPQPAAPTQR